MDWTQGPFTALCNLFPQVDVRIIKATVLDHGNDVESAIDFIIHEVLGCDMEVNKLAMHISGTSPVASAVSTSDTASELEVVKYPPLSPAREITEIDCNGHEESIVWLSEVVACQPADPMSSPSCINKGDATREKVDQICSAPSGSSTTFSHEEKVCSPRHEIVSQSDPFLPSAEATERQEITIPSEKSASLFSASLSEDAVLGNSEARIKEGLNFDSSNLLQQPLDTTFGHRFEEQQSSRQSTSQALSDFVHGEQDRISSCSSSFFGLEDSFQHSEDFKCHEFNLEQKSRSQDKDFLEKSNEFIEHSNREEDSCSHFEVEVPLSSGCEDGATWGTMSSSSNYNVSIESLDEVVKEVRCDKELLMKAIEDLNALRFKAEREEAAAQKEKVDAAKVGQDILKKAEELRQTVARVRAINEMRAGEVFGEKAVLATEARELRLRLTQLKAQKLKAVTFLNDIRTGLQARYELAAKDREGAEEEKRRMKLSAEKVLAMEEALVSKVVQESRDLEAEADACTRLREFLIEQGSIVDSLQGEVAVLCEDVEMLRKQIEEGVLSASSGFFSITRYSGAPEGPYGLMRSNMLSSASSQELPIVGSTESHPMVERSGCVLLSSEGGMCQEFSADSCINLMNSVITNSSSYHVSNGSGQVQSTIGLIQSTNSSLVGDEATSALALTGSALGTEYVSDDCDAETGSCKSSKVGYYQPPDLDMENLNMLKSANTTNTSIKGSSSDDDSWHMLSIPSKKDGLSSGSSFASVGAE